MSPIAAGTAWPPAELKDIAAKYAEHAAWWTGTPEALREVYSRGTRTAQYHPRGTGIRGVISRWWGRPVQASAERRDEEHIPIAADIARASADLLYAEPPTFTCAHKATQDRLDLYAGELHNTLAAGAEVGAVLGGRFHRVTWDTTITDRPFLTTIDADVAYPVFRWGRLVGVTFSTVLSNSNGHQVVRHLERHALAEDGLGLVFHALYDGTRDNLGRQRPLTEHPATAPLATLVDEQGALIAGRTPGLCVAYVPNQTPQRLWRGHSVGQHLGRSDFDGVEGLMDNLDEAYSSWMRDIRLAKARIIVPTEFLRDNGPGRGATFDRDREVYEALNMPPTESSRSEITAQQFDIRVDEHERTCNAIVRNIIHTAGYSPQTFGMGEASGAALTATEVQARERRSFLTRDRKVRNERAAITPLLTKMLTIDAAVFGTSGLDPDETISIDFGDSVQDSALTLANTAESLLRARAASTKTRIQLLHPEWDEERVNTEAAAVLAEATP